MVIANYVIWHKQYKAYKLPIIGNLLLSLQHQDIVDYDKSFF